MTSRESRGNNKTLIRNETPIEEEEPGQDKRPNHSVCDPAYQSTAIHTNKKLPTIIARGVW